MRHLSSRSHDRPARRVARHRTVLIVAGPGDEHAIAVALRVEELGFHAVPLDLARLPELGMAAQLGGRARPRLLVGTRGGLLDPAACAAVWWRRPRPVPADGLEPASRRLSDAEWTAALGGLNHVVDGFWVNPPGAEEVARRKIVQLVAARRVGLEVPRTLVTNDPALARRFVRACRRGAVLKSLSSLREGGYTRGVTASDEALAERLRVGPAILQERVEGLDVRATVVGDAVFAMCADASLGAAPDDVRADWDHVASSARPERLPADLERRLIALHHDLGIRFGAVDLRRRRDGGYAFFEVNPGGQWLHAEVATGHPISSTLAQLLVSARRDRRTVRRTCSGP